MKHVLPILLLLSVIISSCSTSRSLESHHYQTLYQKANINLQLDEQQYTMGCTVQLWRNELIIISLQPVLGIEMIRIEANKDSISIFDKMNRQYTTIAFRDIPKREIQPVPSFKILQDFVTSPNSTTVETKNKQSFRFGKHQISISSSFNQREYNTLKAPRRLDTRKYKRITLRDILPL